MNDLKWIYASRSEQWMYIRYMLSKKLFLTAPEAIFVFLDAVFFSFLLTIENSWNLASFLLPEKHEKFILLFFLSCL